MCDIYSMGIYSNGQVYGVRIYRFDENWTAKILYEAKYNAIMTPHQIREAQLAYSGLTDKSSVSVLIYTECVSTHEHHSVAKYMDWYPVSPVVFMATTQHREEIAEV